MPNEGFKGLFLMMKEKKKKDRPNLFMFYRKHWIVEILYVAKKILVGFRRAKFYLQKVLVFTYVYTCLRACRTFICFYIR